jgi:type IV pilus assembly protein PilN
MIRINLLPEGRKKRKKKKPFPVIIILGVVITLISIIVSGGYTYYLLNKIDELNNEREIKKKEVAKLQEQVKEVEKYEKENQLVIEKTKIIEQLKKNQTGPVRILDELSQRLPKGVWFTSLDDKSGSMSLRGNSFSTGSLVTFVQNLKASEFIKDVNLLHSKQKTINNVTVYEFNISFKVKV